MRYIRLFEELNQGEPKVGDYVLCEIDFRPERNGRIGRIIEYTPAERFYATKMGKVAYNYRVEYFEYGNSVEIRVMVSRDEIKHWSDNKKELEIISQAKKYNL